MARYSKAIIAGVGAFFVIVEPLGISVDTEFQRAVVTLITTYLVFRVPNER